MIDRVSLLTGEILSCDDLANMQKGGKLTISEKRLIDYVIVNHTSNFLKVFDKRIESGSIKLPFEEWKSIKSMKEEYLDSHEGPPAQLPCDFIM